ncbi:MAG TPA: MCE family protein [Micromonosporaceae bacterium]|nr:MCE family protein [Micromonosporaceae bacterium]
MTRWRWVGAFVLVLVLAAAVAVWGRDDPHRHLVARFTRAVGVHVGSDVRVLGVKIGEVVAITPEGRTVRVDMRYSARYDIPADAQAVIIPPSVVSDRYIQLTPAYDGGDRLADGAELPVERTAVPLELDEIYRSLDELNQALGPDGANVDGALTDLVATGRRNLEGNGAALGETLDDLARALTTLADGRDDLFGTVANLQQFTTALARSDAQIREFNQRMAAVGEQLAAERDDLAAALRGLARALADITGFVRDNREALAGNVAALADISGVLVRQQRAIIDVLEVAPLALSNLNLAYNPRSGTLDTRDNALGPYDPASYVCSLLVNLVPVAQVPKECFELARLLEAKRLPLTNELRKLLGLPPVPLTPGSSTPGGAAPGAGPARPGPHGAGPGPLDPVPDLTLGGILKGGRS